MNFMQLLQTLDDLLYEVMSWLVFFPITLWRTLTRPLSMMEYANSELHDRPDQQYADTLSPPLFLLLTLLISHALGQALGNGVNPIVASNKGLAAYITSDGTLLLLRLVLFSIIPLMLAAALLVGSKQAVTRERLKGPFYAQCYPAGGFAFVLGIAVLLIHHERGLAQHSGHVMLMAAMVAYVAVQVGWFRRHLRSGLFAAASYAGGAILGGMIFSIVFALLFV